MPSYRTRLEHRIHVKDIGKKFLMYYECQLHIHSTEDPAEHTEGALDRL